MCVGEGGGARINDMCAEKYMILHVKIVHQ